jgi:hypothetical protein
LAGATRPHPRRRCGLRRATKQRDSLFGRRGRMIAKSSRGRAQSPPRLQLPTGTQRMATADLFQRSASSCLSQYKRFRPPRSPAQSAVTIWAWHRSSPRPKKSSDQTMTANARNELSFVWPRCALGSDAVRRAEYQCLNLILIDAPRCRAPRRKGSSFLF